MAVVELRPAQRTYGQLRLLPSGTHWQLSSVPPNVAIRLKQLFPRISKTDPGPWRFPNDVQHAADLEWFLHRYPMLMDHGDQRMLAAGSDRYQERQNELEQILTGSYQPSPYADGGGWKVETFKGGPA